MKTVLFCGGKGTRWTRSDDDGPKALAMIGERPIIWHVMSVYSVSGFNDFVLCLGHKGDRITRYFEEQGLTLGADGRGELEPVPGVTWRIELVDTGAETQTGGRLRRVADRLDGERFMASYGDGVAALDIGELIRFHAGHGRLATLTAVRPRSQFGILQLGPDTMVQSFLEKPQIEDWVNGGFFVFEPGVLDLLDESPLESGPLGTLARHGQLMAYKTSDYWACLDTYKDKIEIEELWLSGAAPWSTWERSPTRAGIG
jgi:glucose-1-phosphate cytidylyltransferase